MAQSRDIPFIPKCCDVECKRMISIESIPVFYIVPVRRSQADNLWAGPATLLLGPATLTQSSQSSEINRGVTCHRLDTTIVFIVDGQKHHRQT